MITEEELNHIFFEVDSNHDNQIDLDEFQDAVIRLGRKKTLTFIDE